MRISHQGSEGVTIMSAYAYPNPQAVFYQHYEAVRRDEVVGILLALFLGTFGIHHFYLRRTGLGILYCCFCWTGIPTLLGFIECFFMPERVREYNAIQAAGIAAALGIPVPQGIPVPVWGQPGNANVPAAPPAQSAGAAPVAGLVPAAGFVAGGAPAAVTTQLTCSKCQRANPVGAKFCIGCGSAL
jgi:TM2 domain-containing membrane protein YozV